MAIMMPLAWAVLLVLGAVVFVMRLNQAMQRTPPEGLKHMAKLLTRESIRSINAKVKSQGVDFRKNRPPRLNRRYIIVGGSGWIPFVSFEVPLADFVKHRICRHSDGPGFAG